MSVTSPATETPTVVRVVDYEPAPHAGTTAGPRPPSRCRPPRPLRAAVRPPAGAPGGAPPAALSPMLHAAALFTDAALRRVLEVIDQRRPAAQLYPLLAAGLVDSVGAAHPARIDRTATANLQRVRVQAVGSGDPLTVVEAFGTYRRGRRVHAVACRIQRVASVPQPGWQVVALHIG